MRGENLAEEHETIFSPGLGLGLRRELGEPMSVLVTGGAGFIGRHLVSKLVVQNQVTVVDSGISGRVGEVSPRAELVQVDIGSLTLDDWEGLLQGVDVVYHLAAAKHNTPGVSTDALIATNVLATSRLIEAAARSRIQKFVFASSLYAYGTPGPLPMKESIRPVPDTRYGATKLMGESLLRSASKEWGLDATSLRLFFAYGPGQYANGGYKSVIVTNFERLKAGSAPIICGDGNQALDYVFVDDVVDALLASGAAAGPCDPLNVASGSAVRIVDLIALMQEVAGTSFAPVYRPPDWTQGTVRIGDPQEIRQTLGWHAKTELWEGLVATWARI